MIIKPTLKLYPQFMKINLLLWRVLPVAGSLSTFSVVDKGAISVKSNLFGCGIRFHMRIG